MMTTTGAVWRSVTFYSGRCTCQPGCRDTAQTDKDWRSKAVMQAKALSRHRGEDFVGMHTHERNLKLYAAYEQETDSDTGNGQTDIH